MELVFFTPAFLLRILYFFEHCVHQYGVGAVFRYLGLRTILPTEKGTANLNQILQSDTFSPTHLASRLHLSPNAFNRQQELFVPQRSAILEVELVPLLTSRPYAFPLFRARF